MSLPIPVVGEDPGPDWAENYNSCLTIIDGHTHTSGSGAPITPDAIDINADVPFNDNNATTLRTSRYTSQAAPLALADDLACVYVVAGELYYNDLDGNQVKLTEAGSPAGATGTITGLPSGTASASFQVQPLAGAQRLIPQLVWTKDLPRLGKLQLTATG